MKFPLVGNKTVESTLTGAILSNKLPHAIIIEGEDGQGKKTLAKFLSQVAVCTATEKPCLECKNCRLAKAKTHPDVYTVSPEEKKKNISVEQIRRMRNETFVRPQMSDARVFIIEKGETMNENSQNAILKVLEEPAGNTYFIILTNSKSALLDTIRSRCIILSLVSPTMETGKKYLLENTAFSEDEAENALKNSKGNIGKALELLTKKEKAQNEDTAKKYLDEIFFGSKYNMIKLTFPLEKDRISADKFFSDLKYETIARAQKEYKLNSSRNALLKIYDAIEEIEKELFYNANLTLLFTAAADKFKNCL